MTMIIDSIKKEAKTYTPLHWILLISCIFLVSLLCFTTLVEQKRTKHNKEKEIKLKENKKNVTKKDFRSNF